MYAKKKFLYESKMVVKQGQLKAILIQQQEKYKSKHNNMMTMNNIVGILLLGWLVGWLLRLLLRYFKYFLLKMEFLKK